MSVRIGDPIGNGCPTCEHPGIAVQQYVWTEPTFNRKVLVVEWGCSRCLAAWATIERPGMPTIPRYLAQVRPTKSATPHPDLWELSGSVIGYRAWRVKDWALAGTGGFGGAWVPGINEARCNGLGGGHLAPAELCSCGMYGLARFSNGAAWWGPENILGAIEAWADPDPNGEDRFFLHATGFRAQYAKIVLLAVSNDDPHAKNAFVRALAAEHGADVCRKEHLEDAAREHGQLIPDEWLEWAKDTGPAVGAAWPTASRHSWEGGIWSHPLATQWTWNP